eukprot:snap_masked-scaffold_87-processed-gene-0.4-mRNA-1 protein AED:1.00 eAED:1.00 QI:0/-1/0/0/-1/1/1/0/94
MDRVTRKRKKVKKLLLETDSRKKDLQMIEVSITEKHEAYKQGQLTTYKKSKKAGGSNDNNKERVSEIKTEDTKKREASLDKHTDPIPGDSNTPT